MAEVTTGPTGNDPASTPVFGDDSALLYQNGRWGAAGYAVPNPGGKLFCMNETVWSTVDMLGRGLFEIMHREDRRFIKPLTKDIVWDIYALITAADKRVQDVAVLPNQLELRSEHATPVQKAFTLYPVPFFGDACKNMDLRRYASCALSCLTECMQHSEADKSNEITWQGFGVMMRKHLFKIKFNIVTKYFGYSRTDLYWPSTDQANPNQPKWDFALTIDDWRNYGNKIVSVSFETTEERVDPGWVATENDLRAIRGIPAPLAMPFCVSYAGAPPPFFGGIQFNKPLGEKPTGSLPTTSNTFGGPPA